MPTPSHRSLGAGYREDDRPRNKVAFALGNRVASKFAGSPQHPAGGPRQYIKALMAVRI